jgi:hypothetical protein
MGTNCAPLLADLFLYSYEVGLLQKNDHRKTFEVMTSTELRETLGSVASLLAATLYQRNPNRNHQLWNIVSTERYIFHMQVLEFCYI